MPSERVLRVYGLRNCDSCRKALRWLDARGVNYRFVDLRETPPAPQQLKAWLSTAQGAALVNRRSTTWRQLPEGERARADSEPAALLLEHPMLLKRPVIADGSRLLAVGFNGPAYEARFRAEA